MNKFFSSKLILIIILVLLVASVVGILFAYNFTQDSKYDVNLNASLGELLPGKPSCSMKYADINKEQVELIVSASGIYQDTLKLVYNGKQIDVIKRNFYRPDSVVVDRSTKMPTKYVLSGLNAKLKTVSCNITIKPAATCDIVVSSEIVSPDGSKKITLKMSSKNAYKTAHVLIMEQYYDDVFNMFWWRPALYVPNINPNRTTTYEVKSPQTIIRLGVFNDNDKLKIIKINDNYVAINKADDSCAKTIYIGEKGNNEYLMPLCEIKTNPPAEMIEVPAPEDFPKPFQYTHVPVTKIKRGNPVTLNFKNLTEGNIANAELIHLDPNGVTLWNTFEEFIEMVKEDKRRFSFPPFSSQKVSVPGDIIIYPTEASGYVLNVSNQYGTGFSCFAFIEVEKEIVNPPSCTITGPSSVFSGSDVTLAWTSKNMVGIKNLFFQKPGPIDGGIDIKDGTTTYVVKNISTTTEFVLAGSNSTGDTANCRTTVIVTPAPLPSCTITATPSSIQSGQSTTLNWTKTSMTNDVRLTTIPSGGTLESNPISGSLTSKSVSPTVTTTYRISGQNSAGVSDQCEVTIPVTPAPPAQPSCTLTPSKTINHGDSVTIAWTSTNVPDGNLTMQYGASTAGIGPRLDPGTPYAISSNSSQTFTPTENTVYTVKGYNNGLTTKCQSTVTVTQPPAPSCQFTAPTTAVNAGSNVTLQWTEANTTGDKTLRRSVGAPVSNTIGTVYRSHVVGTLETTTIFTLEVKNTANVMKSCTKTVEVIPPPPPPTTLSCTITTGDVMNDPNSGPIANLSWTSTGASGGTLNFMKIGSSVPYKTENNVAANGTNFQTPVEETSESSKQNNVILEITNGTETATCSKDISWK